MNAAEVGCREMFPGILDPGGRPWEQWGTAYDEAIATALKTGFLFQERVPISIGYLFDNPPLQRLIYHHSADDREGQAFRQLLGECLEVGCQTEHEGAIDDTALWNDLLSNWLTGDDWRLSPVAPCSLPDDAIKSLPRESAVGSYVGLIEKVHHVSLVAVLRTLARAAPRRALQRAPYVFEDIFFEAVERISMPRQLRDKLDTLRGAAAAASPRIQFSRSLMTHPQTAIDLGVTPETTITRPEYDDHLLEIARHAQQAGFARMHGSLFAQGEGNRIINAYRADPVQEYIDDLPAQVASERTQSSLRRFVMGTPDVDDISFETIARLRQSTRFKESLATLAKARGGVGEITDALDQHLGFLGNRILRDELLRPPEVAQAFAERLLSGEKEIGLASLGTLALSLTVGLPFLVYRLATSRIAMYAYGRSVSRRWIKQPTE